MSEAITDFGSYPLPVSKQAASKVDNCATAPFEEEELKAAFACLTLRRWHRC